MFEKICVYIDGANLYRNLKANACANLDFDFRKFVESFLDSRSVLVRINYYIGAVQYREDSKSQELLRSQQLLFDRLNRFGFNIITRKLHKIAGTFIEKGVDVQLAVDMLEGAYENTYDRAVLVSSDGDFAPVIEKILAKGKKVDVVGFERNPSYALIQKASSYHTIRKNDLLQWA